MITLNSVWCQLKNLSRYPSGSTSHKGSGKSKKSSGKKKRRSAKTPTRAPVVDPLSKVAMENAYMICHSAEQFLSIRGFPYSGTLCKGGKKGGGKKKKKRK